MSGHYLAALFEPRSVALVGASASPGRSMLEMCARLGFVESGVPDDPITRKVTLDLGQG